MAWVASGTMCGVRDLVTLAAAEVDLFPQGGTKLPGAHEHQRGKRIALRTIIEPS